MSVFIAFFVDGLGYDIGKNLHFSFCKNFYKKRLKTVLGYSFAAASTIFSGKMPSEHGHFSLVYAKPKSGAGWLGHYSRIILKGLRLLPFVSLQDFLFVLKKSRVQKLPLGKKISAILNFFVSNYRKIKFDIPEIQNFCKDFAKIIDKKNIKMYGWPLRENDIFRRLRNNLLEKKFSFYLVYLCSFDNITQDFGINSPEMKEKMNFFEKNISEIFEIASKMYKKVYFCIFSDHGMCEVKKIIDVKKKIEEAKAEKKDFLYVLDATMARFWFFSEKAKKAILKKIREIKDGRILSKKEMKKLHVYFPDERYGELIFLANPGVLIFPNIINTLAKAIHGYYPSCKKMDALWMSNFLPKKIEHIKDIYNVIAEKLKDMKNMK